MYILEANNSKNFFRWCTYARSAAEDNAHSLKHERLEHKTFSGLWLMLHASKMLHRRWEAEEKETGKGDLHRNILATSQAHYAHFTT